MRQIREIREEVSYVYGNVAYVCVDQAEVFERPRVERLKGSGRKAELFRELTWQGKALCLLLGLLELAVVYALCGIRAAYAPVLISGFLCVLFAVMTAGVWIGLDELFSFLEKRTSHSCRRQVYWH